MKANFKFNFLNTLAAKKNSEKGFTLIELLVVVIIIGVLAAIALPNLLGQVAKGRQSEAKNNLGAINRAQQAFRLEKARFGAIGDGVTGSEIDSRISGEFYVYADETGVYDTDSALGSAHTAFAQEDYENDIKDYASSVYQGTDGSFRAVICEADEVDGDATDVRADADPANEGDAACTSGVIVN